MKKKKAQPKTRIRVMLVDDHASIREALRTIIGFESDLTVVAEADCGRAALQLFNRARPDVVLMDGSMPDMSGIETTRRLKQSQNDVKIIGLTLYGQNTYLEEMVELGAKGYVLKTSDPADVVKAVRIVAAGGTYFDPAVPRRAAMTSAGKSATEELTAPELSVAKLLANGLTNAEIADSLGLKIPAVEAHRTSALNKLGVRSRAGLVRIAAERHWLEN